jgi:hypothetical protein
VRSRVTISSAAIAAIAAVLVLSSASSVAAKPSLKNGPFKWPSTLTGQLITPFVGNNPKPLPTGTVVSSQTIAKSKKGYSWVSSFDGNNGYALVYLNGFQYPLISRNGGLTWTTSSSYWSGPWADAGAGANFISTFSSTTAAAYGNQWIYSTSDGGRQWYLTSPYNVESVEPSSVEWWVPHEPTNGIIANVSQTGTYNNANNVIARAQYLTTNGGKTWRLLPAPKQKSHSRQRDLSHSTLRSSHVPLEASVV